MFCSFLHYLTSGMLDIGLRPVLGQPRLFLGGGCRLAVPDAGRAACWGSDGGPRLRAAGPELLFRPDTGEGVTGRSPSSSGAHGVQFLNRRAPRGCWRHVGMAVGAWTAWRSSGNHWSINTSRSILRASGLLTRSLCRSGASLALLPVMRPCDGRTPLSVVPLFGRSDQKSSPVRW